MGGIFSVLKFKHQTLDTIGNHYISAIHPHPSEVNILQRKDLYRQNSEMFILTRRSVPQEDTEVLAKCVCTHQQSFKISEEKSDKAEKNRKSTIRTNTSLTEIDKTAKQKKII